MTPLRLLRTPPHPCSYLPQQQARTLFVDPQQSVSLSQYQQLTHLGFRRSGKVLYRPQCEQCQACRSWRVIAQAFKPSRSQRRILKRNEDLRITLQPAGFSREQYHLFERYIDARHRDGDMYPTSEQQYRDFLLAPNPGPQMLSFHYTKSLLAVAVIDCLSDGLSALYTFFDPQAPARSLGTYAILTQLSLCRQMALPYLYLGYWVANSEKMAYKSAFVPAEVFDGDQWCRCP